VTKIKKSQFKKIVKECLVEILSEGLYSMSTEISRSTAKMSHQKINEGSSHIKKSNTPRKTVLDSISYGDSPKFDNAVENSVSTLTSDPIMKAIFSDTARTTLQEQLANEPGGASSAQSTVSDAASLAMSNSDPTDIFGDSAKNWEALAFSDSSNKSDQ